MMTPRQASKSVEMYTPAPVVEAARRVLGGFDLDPASCPLANEIVRATRIYTREDDGLSKPWAGRVFLNPPGGRAQLKGFGTGSNAALWWGTLAAYYAAGLVTSAIFIGFTIEVLSTAQALDVPQPLDCPLCVPAARLEFDTDKAGVRAPATVPVRRNGEIVGEAPGPPHANVIVLLPDPQHREEQTAAFRAAFSDIGRVRA